MNVQLQLVIKEEYLVEVRSGKRFPEARPVCPACGSRMDGTEKKDDWFDELAEMDMILDDD